MSWSRKNVAQKFVKSYLQGGENLTLHLIYLMYNDTASSDSNDFDEDEDVERNQEGQYTYFDRDTTEVGFYDQDVQLIGQKLKNPNRARDDDISLFSISEIRTAGVPVNIYEGRVANREAENILNKVNISAGNKIRIEKSRIENGRTYYRIFPSRTGQNFIVAHGYAEQ